MTVYVTGVLGHAREERFKDRRVVGVPVAWDEASKRRLRRAAADGSDVAIDLPDATYLAEGTVLHDDGNRILVIRRQLEPTLVVRFDPELPRDRVIEQALAVGHAFGNQHVPLEVESGEVRVPLTTSEAVARAT
ncbi:MAG: urease accessory protein UreE, partial [Actinomycetota bacterium]|nr:urease accessory protein UreE [Actinomycetota bacterium]